MRTIFKQTSYLFLSQSITRLFSFVYLIYIAKALGVDNFGLISVALAYFSLTASISDFGFNRFLIREITEDKNKIGEYLWNVVLTRLTFSAVIFGVLSIVLFLTDSDKLRVSLILLSLLALLPQSIALTFDSLFVSLQKLQYSAISLFLSSVVNIFLGFWLVLSGFGVIGVICALIISQVVYVFITTFFLYREKILSIHGVANENFKKILKGSLPYGILGILGLVYFRIDTIMLSYFRGNFETGLYGTAYRFFEAASFIPVAFSTAIFPIFIKLQEQKNLLRNRYFKSVGAMFVVGVFVLLIFQLILPGLVISLLPSFNNSIEAVKILSFSIPFMFMASPGVQIMMSQEKYLKKVIGLSIFTVTFNVVLNLLFIPRYGILAASWITVASEVLSFIIFFIFIRYNILSTKNQ